VFYLLRVAADGRSASLSRLPISGPGPSDVALSPDGSTLAMVVQPCPAGTCQGLGIRVVTLATGAASTWTTRARGDLTDVSWDGDGQIFFAWRSASLTGPRSGYRLLSITGASRDLLSSRVVAPAAAPGNAPAALVTPDGTAIITSTAHGIPDGHGRDTVVSKIVELSLATGRLLQVLHTASESVATSSPVAGTGILSDDCQVFALGPAGVHALVYCVGFGTTGFGRLDGTRFTPLPGVPSLTTTSQSDWWGRGDW
jgi:hypothetical protein